MRGPIVAALLPLAACATVPAEPGEKVDTCNPAPGQNFLGQRASPQVAAQVLNATGATRLRWLPPRSVVLALSRSPLLPIEVCVECP